MTVIKPFLLAQGFVAILAFVLPALADVSENVVLQATSAINLDTGAVSSSGGDLLWNGSTLAPQGSAKIGSLGTLGYTTFEAAGQSFFGAEAPTAKTNPIAAGVLVPGRVLVAVSNSGKVAGMMVVANGGGSITLRFTTFGASAPAGVPLITGISNNSSGIKPGLPNYGIAPSSLFIITGTNLADPADLVLQSSAPPGLPLTLNGASISVTVNGVTTSPALYYTSPKQLAAVLPASTPVGLGTFTVTYRGTTSAPSPIQVVPTAVGINSYNGALGVATDGATGALLTYTNSASPGQAIVLWSTGLGADPADSDSVFSAAPNAVNTPLVVYIGGVQATVLYQGSAGYPGVNQINVTVPQGAAPGCWVSVAAVTAGNVVSNIVTIPISNGGGDCLDAQTGLTGSQLSPSGGGTLRAGLISLIQTNSVDKNGQPQVQNSANGAFVRYTGLYAPAQQLSPGACLVNPQPVPIPGVTFLDAGMITMTGPARTVTLGNPLGVKGEFNAILTPADIPSTGGTFTFKGSGGADVGPFTTTLTLANPLLVWTNKAAAANVDRTQGYTVTWTGGNPGSLVFVSGTSTSGTGVLGSFECLASADARQFTVPPYVLLSIPAGSGGALVQNSVSAPLSASGLDVATAIAAVSFSTSATFK